MKTKKIVLNIFISLTLFLSGSAGPSISQAIGKIEHEKMREKILRTFMSRLPAKHVHKADIISDTIMQEYETHKIDPMILTAVVAGESNFNPHAIGPIGEVGLMQLRPATAKWIADRAGIKWRGAWALRDPVYNIHLGAAYLGYLKRKYSPKDGFLFLTAYNMGETTLQRLLDRNIVPSIYSDHIMKNYLVINI